MNSSYKLSASVRLRLFGAALVAIGVAVGLVAGLVALLALPSAVMTGALVVGAAAVVLTGLGLHRAAPLVSLDETGYRLRLLRGAGVAQARWRDVEDVVTATVSGDDCVVLRLRDGRTTTIPVAVLNAPREDFVRDLGEHLNHGHGYRPVR